MWLRRARDWAAAHRRHSVAVGAALVLLAGATFAIWSYLARLAIQSGRVYPETALAAFDQGRYEDARAMVSRMLADGYLPRSDYGAPLFVLGAVKFRDAQSNGIPEQRRIEYLVASRYLTEARANGFPAGREGLGMHLLGHSLLESQQYSEGLAVLDELLESGDTHGNDVLFATHRLLAEACLWMPVPQLEKALGHCEALLQSAELTDDERTHAFARRAECLARLGRFDEAREALAQSPTGSEGSRLPQLARAQIVLDELDAMLSKTVATEREQVIASWVERLSEVDGWLSQIAAERLENPALARRAQFLLGRSSELRGDSAGALQQYAQIRQQFDKSWEVFAAGLAEAELMRRDADFPLAMSAYRRTLESLAELGPYRSEVLPLPVARERLTAAMADLIDRQRFADAIALLNHADPLFEQIERLQIRGNSLQRWGEALLNQSDAAPEEALAARTDGLRHLREAGMAFEQLAKARFATAQYTDDLWTSAECYFRGHSFSRAIEVLNEYVRHEPDRRNAQALLRLGQSHLALGRIGESIDAFQECIEFHPQDSATYQARLDSAKAHWYLGDVDAAEKLLQENIAGSELKPVSREWKDSLFELGMLLYEYGRYEGAAATLEHAIERYPDDAQVLLAKYVLGQSYRGQAEGLRERGEAARTTSERNRNERQAADFLATALIHFTDVQRSITLRADAAQNDPLLAAMQRNCYMLAGAVQFDLGQYNEAINAFSNVSSLYPNDPFVLETFVQIAHCWRRLGQADKARGAVEQAQIALERLAPDSEFADSTPLSRDEWRRLLADMSRW
jgi:tetratricopeptide (TPR) repeat protein